MLKLNRTALLTASIGALLVAGQGMAQSTGTTTGNGQGVVHFRGVIVSSTCVVSSNDADKTVQLGQWPTTSFPTAGAKTSSVSFQINLNNCPSTGQYTLRFDGPTPAGQPNLLAVSSDTSFNGGKDVPNSPDAPSGASGAASGVGIEILDNQNQAVPIGQDSASGNTFNWQSPDSSGNVAFNLKAHYKSYTDSVTAGLANADATFTIEYQ